MAALVVGLTAVPALASTWTVHPGGNYSGTASAGSTVITDTTTGNSVTCSKSKITGHLTSGTVATGNHIATITAATFTGCTSPLGTATVTAAGLPWFLNAISYASPITSGRVTGIDLTLSTGTCSATVDGTAAAANDGKIKFRFSNADSALKFIAPAVSLAFWGASTGCSPTFGNDPASYVAGYPITPSQMIKSP